MIQNELQDVVVKTFNNNTNEYGQLRQTYTSHNTEMVIKVSSQTNVNDPRYVNVTNVGITKDKTIIPGNQIVANADVYDVLYIIPSSRYYTVLMRKN